MPRRTRSSSLETRTARLKLPIRGKPFFVAIAPGISLGYRRNKTAGAWIVRAADGKGGNWTKAFAVADDHETSSGESVIDFWQAQDKARQLARGNEDESSTRPITVNEALAHYETALQANGGDPCNVSRVRYCLPDTLGNKAVALLNARELRTWRDGLIKKGLAPSSADRTARILKAALNLAAGDDQKITNARAWGSGLSRLPDTEQARNVILTETQVRAVVAAAYAVDPEYGRLIELHAVTGARTSQLLRVTAADIQDGAAPRLMVPSSRKGRRRRSERKPLPIPGNLAKSLRRATADRSRDEPLFPGRADWRDRLLFIRAAADAGLDAGVTPYALRHSSIVRQLLAGVPIRVVASHHDTSVGQIERSYSKHITGDPSDSITRRSLLDLAAPSADNVLPMPGKR